MQTFNVFLPPEAKTTYIGDASQQPAGPRYLSVDYTSPDLFRYLTARPRYRLHSLHQGMLRSIVGIGDKRKRLLDDLDTRLNSVNNHFRRKAADVLGDEHATMLLARLYQETSIRLVDFDACQNGIPLARLTAANFCAIGANVIYITEAGQAFIESIANNDR